MFCSWCQCIQECIYNCICSPHLYMSRHSCTVCLNISLGLKHQFYIFQKNEMYTFSLEYRVICIYTVKGCTGRPVMHIPPSTWDRGFKETGAGLLVVLWCDCVVLCIVCFDSLVSGDSLVIKELTCAIIRNFILYFDWFWAHLLETLVCFEVHKVPRIGPRQKSADSLKDFLYIDWGVSVSCSVYNFLLNMY